jgi:hypothetical protein
MLLDRYWDTRRDVTRGYVALVAATFLFFYPFLTGDPVPAPWYYYDLHGVRPWTWFKTWV